MNLVFYETKFNKYSITALISSLEHAGLLNKISVEVTHNPLIYRPKKHTLTIFCFSFCSPHVIEIKEVVKNIKAKYSDAILIAGGPHPSGEPLKTLNMGFDYIFVGEAEKIFPLFINDLLKNNYKNKHILLADSLIDIDSYPAWSFQLKRFSPLEITRGCPFACKFCQTSYLFGTQPRHRSIESIVSHVEFLTKHGIKDLRFITPNALSYGSEDGKNVNLNAIETLLKSIKSISDEIKIFFGTFPSEVRPEHLTKDVLNLIKGYISNKFLTIGAQSGSNKILESSHRGHNLDDVYNAVKNALDAGFSVNIDFIFGLPEESKNDQIETIKFIDYLLNLGYKKNLSVKIHTHYFMPLPGTPFGKSKPSKLSKEMTQFIGKLHNIKTAFGQWHIQKLYASESINK